jgi:hypothetical protein
MGIGALSKVDSLVVARYTGADHVHARRLQHAKCVFLFRYALLVRFIYQIGAHNHIRRERRDSCEERENRASEQNKTTRISLHDGVP